MTIRVRLDKPKAILFMGCLGMALIVAGVLIGRDAEGARLRGNELSTGAAYSAITAEPPSARTAGSMRAAGATLTAEALAGANCTADARYQEDVTVPDNTFVEPGEIFVKTWRVANEGTCAWGKGYQLEFVGGAQMEGPDAVDVPETAAGGSVEISVELVAPARRGAHRGDWQMRSPSGLRFGSLLYIQIIVEGDAE